MLFIISFQIDCHDSGTESDGDLDSEDLNERDLELSEYIEFIYMNVNKICVLEALTNEQNGKHIF